MNKQKMAVIGLGHMGRHMIHRLLPQYTEKIELVAICDSDESSLHREAAEAGIYPRLYTDYRQLLDEVTLDLVYIAVPPSLHYDVARIAFEKGVHVFCEKPLANSLTEARSLVELAEKADVLHAVHFSLPLDPAVLKLRGLLEQQAIGRIQSMDLYLEFPQWPRAWQQNPWITSRQQGGYLLEVGIHWIQMIQQVFGPITHVKSEIEFPPDSNQSESRVQAVLRLHHDIEIRLSGTDQREGEERVSLVVHGEEGTLALENWCNLYRSGRDTELQPVPVDDVISPLPILKQIVQILNGESGLIYDFHDGYNAQVVLEALRKPSEGFVDVRPQLMGDQTEGFIVTT
ncbi:Gfo/Idh/MocA family oxidoreductase [Paenibacillus sp. JNUCC32]|uniref:Gfo/Idh/MocA family protein n=1 Tax=Paenibacillus sp. JNUCC32 TaxID=2777984 RepID=UPI0017884C9E|nr:Gfo/Idh/MocA family oxidoreductase [Paenibacillus sp. JNUCC-32]QOT08479.1 Gfo/Idh/MocA family oxidoreductase [Paenibacillus sp. JNUCC-32]